MNSTLSLSTTFIVHSKLAYCKSLHSNLLNSQLNRLQQIQNKDSSNRVINEPLPIGQSTLPGEGNPERESASGSRILSPC